MCSIRPVGDIEPSHTKIVFLEVFGLFSGKKPQLASDYTALHKWMLIAKLCAKG